MDLEKMKCKYCKSDVSPSAMKCPHCREKLDPAEGLVLTLTLGAVIIFAGAIVADMIGVGVWFAGLFGAAHAILLLINKRWVAGTLIAFFSLALLSS